jgi:predicted nucleic acid-binding protein
MYLDSAILVKLVVREPDSEYYADLVEGQRVVRSSEIAMTECRSALLRKGREGLLDARTVEGAWMRLQALWSGGGLMLHPVTRSVLLEAGEVIKRCMDRAPLRTLDAIHIASCLQSLAFPLITNDQVMRKAAETLRVPLGAAPR